ncbi:hypothetical protein CCACVL1_15276 [Corchorus capsularis]|uniref:CASP-like protein n=1 Tax=Corchorus capsularis TaxID=210143 RepID=A0A1R3I2Z1_COCAP|nr:hypothetical protein CCACVL1_15276 [Corchorus capsularis]
MAYCSAPPCVRISQNAICFTEDSACSLLGFFGFTEYRCWEWVVDAEELREWCIADKQTPDEELKKALDWACGKGGADCSKLQVNQPCYHPNTIRDHASYAFNSYYHKFKTKGATCYFNSAAMITDLDPTFGINKTSVLERDLFRGSAANLAVPTPLLIAFYVLEQNAIIGKARRERMASAKEMDTQVKEIFSIQKKARFTDMKALVFLVVANGVAAAYSLVQVVRCVVGMVRGSVLFSKPLAWAIFSGDQAMAYLSVAAVGAAAQSAVFAKLGQPDVQWMKICNMYGKFCNQIGEGIAIALLVSLAMVLLSCISAFTLFRLYGGTKPKNNSRW